MTDVGDLALRSGREDARSPDAAALRRSRSSARRVKSCRAHRSSQRAEQCVRTTLWTCARDLRCGCPSCGYSSPSRETSKAWIRGFASCINTTPASVDKIHSAMASGSRWRPAMFQLTTTSSGRPFRAGLVRAGNDHRPQSTNQTTHKLAATRALARRRLQSANASEAKAGSSQRCAVWVASKTKEYESSVVTRSKTSAPATSR